MNFLMIFIVLTQVNTPASINKSVIAVTVDGYAESSYEASEYEIILYADADDKEKKIAEKEADDLVKEIKNAVIKMGGKEKDVSITSTNTYDPIEGDPYYRIEQDIKIFMHNVKDIDAVKSTFLEINGVQIGSTTPVIPENVDYGETVIMARKDAVTKASNEANALAKAFNVMIGEPVFVTESVLYPDYNGYDDNSLDRLTVKLTVYYEMIYKK